MIETIVVEVDEIKFNIQQFPALTAIKLEKKTLTLLSPLLGIFDNKVLDSEIDISSIATAMRNFLIGISEDQFISYIKEMFSTTMAELKKDMGLSEKPILVKIDNEDNFNIVFTGRNLTVYKLLIEIMKVNKFSFFEIIESIGGIETLATDFLGAQKKSKKKSKKK